MVDTDARLTWSWSTSKGCFVTTLSLLSKLKRSLEYSMNGSTLKLDESNSLLAACKMLVMVEVQTSEMLLVIGTI